MNERAPARLGRSGKRLWKDVTERYSLRPDELRLLEDCCRTSDLIDTLQASIDGAGADGLTVKGSMGQQVISPAISEIRQQRSQLRQMLARLDLPDAEGNSPAAGRRSAKASTAARARWNSKSA